MYKHQTLNNIMKYTKVPDVSDAYGPLTELPRIFIEFAINRSKKSPYYVNINEMIAAGKLRTTNTTPYEYKVALDLDCLERGVNGTFVIDLDKNVKLQRIGPNCLVELYNIFNAPIVFKHCRLGWGWYGSFHIKFHFDGPYRIYASDDMHTDMLRPTVSNPIPAHNVIPYDNTLFDCVCLGDDGNKLTDSKYSNGFNVNREWYRDGLVFKRRSFI